ncbi:MAG: patatin-like phospholipase family protein [bacterium]
MTRRAIVLSGGGARGAYAAGVLRYILDELTEDLGHAPHLDIVCGTSVGAILAAWVASTLERPDHSGQRLWYLWRTMRLAETVRIEPRSVFTMVNRLFRDTGESSLEPTPGRTIAPLNTSFFSNLVTREIPFAQIRKNMDAGLLDAVTVTCTDVHTGRATVFADYERSELPPWTRDLRRRAVRGPLTPEKVLASASIPVLFPSVKIDGHWYFDGGLRQNTPISPAIRLGADRVLVIGLKSAPSHVEPPAAELAAAPSVSFAMGKMLNALLLDPLDYDLAFLERINGLLRHGEHAFGKDHFIPTLNEVVETYRGQGYRLIDTLLVRPSVDLGRLATDLAGQMRDSEWGSTTMRTIGRRAAEMQGYRESDFLSYLLFDGRYTGELLDLGWRDAQVKHKQLLRFFSE